MPKMESIELEDCIIPPEKQGMVAQRVFAKHCSEGSVEMKQEEFEAAMNELGVTDFASDRDGAHDIFKRYNSSITRTKFGSLRFVRTKTRHMTDVPCLLLFLVYWCAMFWVADLGLREGDPNRLLYAVDYQGNTCGRWNYTGQPLIYYPELEKDMVRFAMLVAADPTKAKLSNFESAGKCVSECPRKGTQFELGGKDFKVHFHQKELMMRCFSKYPKSPLFFGKCKEFAPNVTSALTSALPKEGPCENYASEWQLDAKRICSELTTPCDMPAVDAQGKQITVEEPCKDYRPVICLTNTKPCDSLMNTYYESKKCCKEAMNAVYPKCETYKLGSGNYNENPLMNNPVFQKMMAASAALGRAFGDMTRAATLILLCGGLFTVMQGIAWSGLVQIMARPVIVVTLILCTIVPFFIMVFCYSKAGLLDGHDQWNVLLEEHGLNELKKPSVATRPDLLSLEDEIESYKYIGYGFNALWVCIALYLIHLRNYIRVAIGMIKEASRALRQMPLMIVYPLFPIAMIFVLCFYFMYIAAHLASIESFNDVHVDAQPMLNLTASLGDGISAFSNLIGSGGENSTLGTMVSSLDQFRNSSGRNYTITPNQQLQGLLWFHLFGFLWANNVINGIWCCTVAGAMCRWYWMFQEDKDHKEFEKFITWVRRQRAPARVRGACSWPPAAPAPTRKRTLIHPPPAPNPNTRGCSCDAPAAVVSALLHCSQVSFKKTMRYFLGSICYGSILITLMQVRTSSQRCTLRCGHAASLLRLR